jgi:hypothetical protein
MSNLRIYSPEEIQFLTENYFKLGRIECARILNRTSFSVGVKASKLNLQKPQKLIDPVNNKFCKKCEQELKKTFFCLDKRRKDQLHPTCNFCLKQYRITPQYKARKKKYDSIRVSFKMKTDPKFKLNRYLRKRMNSALKNQGLRKTFKTNQILGCTNSFFIDYLKSKFKDGMTLENHGKFGWHIDHIIPCAAFDLSDLEQQKQCFHFTNLQPLWWYENLSKKDKII